MWHVLGICVGDFLRKRSYFDVIFRCGDITKEASFMNGSSKPDTGSNRSVVVWNRTVALQVTERKV